MWSASASPLRHPLRLLVFETSPPSALHDSCPTDRGRTKRTRAACFRSATNSRKAAARARCLNIAGGSANSPRPPWALCWPSPFRYKHRPKQHGHAPDRGLGCSSALLQSALSGARHRIDRPNRLPANDRSQTECFGSSRTIAAGPSSGRCECPRSSHKPTAPLRTSPIHPRSMLSNRSISDLTVISFSDLSDNWTKKSGWLIWLTCSAYLLIKKFAKQAAQFFELGLVEILQVRVQHIRCHFRNLGGDLRTLFRQRKVNDTAIFQAARALQQFLRFQLVEHARHQTGIDSQRLRQLERCCGLTERQGHQDTHLLTGDIQVLQCCIHLDCQDVARFVDHETDALSRTIVLLAVVVHRCLR